MLRRKITDKLVEWKNSPNKKCLLIEGARQVGKTFAVRRFAAENYKHFIEINFEKNNIYHSIFDDSIEVDDIVAQLSLLFPDIPVIPGETLIFLDEIQSCPRARSALKFFTDDGRFDVVASGSLLGIHYKEVPSLPVGYETRIRMHSLDFEEFLWARGVGAESVGLIKKRKQETTSMPSAAHEKFLSLFKEYMVVGGMPAVVQDFVNANNFASVLKLQKDIVAGYLDDIAKYAPMAEKSKAKACFQSIPKQLSRDYKKFSYSVVEKNSSARKYGGSLQWLYDAGIINFCYNLERPELPLEGNAMPNSFKVYMNDTGLLVSMLDDGSQKDLIDGKFGIYKGAVFENVIAEIFTKADRALYYYERPSKIEVDFITRINDEACAVEVKSALSRRSKSLTTIINYYGVESGIKLSPSNLVADGSILTLPLYMAPFINGL